jgi:proteasome lid subunit RPN8/RPN11
MTETRSRAAEPIDVRLLARQELPHEAFPGGRNEDFRVFFTPEVHAELWRHAALDTSVEICGVLVGSWHRDEVGPFVQVLESIRGEGADTRFAEVTFTHETWAKINTEMDTKFSNLSIVGWYHTHPDFGIFLSDRDRFIHEHFFSGPGQVAHVIDPIRKIEGVFVWRGGKPALSEHYWIGDRILTGAAGGEQSGSPSSLEPRAGSSRAGGPSTVAPAPGGTQDPSRRLGDLLPPPGRLLVFGGVFLLGYLLANILSAWERQRFVESVLVSNGFVAVLRLDLSEELDRLRGDLAAMLGPLESIQSQGEKASEPVAEIRAKLAVAARRTAAIKARYGNTQAEDDLLRRFFRDKLTRMLPPEQPRVERARTPVGSSPSAPTSDAAKSTEAVSSEEPPDSNTRDSKNGGAAAKP